MDSSWEIDFVLEKIEQEYMEADLDESWKNEQTDVESSIERLMDEFAVEYTFIDCIAVAGSRIVLEVEDSETEDTFALKICRPFEEAIEPVKEEFENIQDLYHNNLIKIFSEKEVEIDSEKGETYEIPITVEEYIPDGKHLRDWLIEELDDTSKEYDIIHVLYKLQTIFGQIVDGLNYLHEHHVYHCDLKPQNILVKEETPKIVDFGYSKKRLPGLEYTDSHSSSQVGFTWDYAWPPLREHIEKMESPEAAYAGDEDEFSYGKIDQYGLGRTIEECIKLVKGRRLAIQEEIHTKSPDRRFQHEREAQYFENYLDLIAGRLKGVDALEDLEDKRGYIANYSEDLIDKIEYADHPFGLRDARRDLSRMDIEDLGSLAPEWDDNLPDRIRVGSVDVPFTPRIRRLYNHPALSQLSQVSQLGLVTYVYPGARHSRLEHMMGTYSKACDYIESIWTQKEDPFFRCITTENEVIAASLGALLHDIGQYPHCHDIEDALITMETHEVKSIDLYRRDFEFAEDTFRSVKEIVKEEWNPVVARLVEKFLGDFDSRDSSSMPRISLLRGVISSSIDADKLDYVQRDSHNLGVEYGARIEEDRLVNNLRPIVKTGDGTRTRVQMGLNQKGNLPAQSLIIAREQMYERAYWHKTVRSFKSMLKTALRRDSNTKEIVSDLVEEFRFGADSDIKIVGDGAPSFHLVESDQWMLEQLYSRLSDAGAKHLIREILLRKPYQPLIDLDIDGKYGHTDREEIEQAIKPLQRALEPPTQDVEYIEKVRKELQRVLLNRNLIELDGRFSSGARTTMDQVCVLVDIPTRSAFGSSTVWVSGDKPGEAYEVNINSTTEGGSQMEEWRKSVVPRIYLHKAYEYDEIDTHTITSIIRDI